MKNKKHIKMPVTGRDAGEEKLYSAMFSIRVFEKSLLDMFETGDISGTTHTCLGQESTAVGVISAMDREKDIIFSNHRGHGHFLSYCGEAERLYLELMGCQGGVCGGRGGSQHLNFNNFYSNGIQGGIVSVSSGIAMAEKMKESGAVTAVFLGDGTLGEGSVYESMNIASLWSLPILFVIDNNGYAQSTPNYMQIAGEIKKRPEAFNIITDEVAGEDVREILSLSSDIIDAVRHKGEPRCLIINSVRLGPHSKGDDSRDEEEITKAGVKDPVKIMENNIESNLLKELQGEASGLMLEAKKQAMKR